MSDEKKPGFFARLFGRGNKEEAPAPEVKAEEVPALVEAEKPAEPIAEKPKPAPKKPEAKKVEPKKPAAKAKATPKAEEPKAEKPKAKPAAKKPTAKKEAANPAPAAEAKPASKVKPKSAEKPETSSKPATKPKAEAKPKPVPKPATEVTPLAEPPSHDVSELDEELSHLDPGPPETTPEWLEEHPAPVAATEPAPEPEKKKSWFQRLAGGLKRSSDQLTSNISAVFTHRKLDVETLEELEDILIQADLGIDTAMTITAALAKDKYDKEISADDVRQVMAAEVEKVLEPVAQPLEIDTARAPFVILMIGVNGSGKTTTIGKMAQKLGTEGKSVMLAAGDTFRAAAIEQLQIWGERTGAPVIVRPTGSDASGLAFDAVTEAKEAGSDVLIIDTAGRLQNRDELMAELEKIIRVIKKVDDSAPHAVLLTLDATTGQNALNQVEIFGQRAGVTGLVMTKLDGTARGGILVAIAKKFALPVHYIGVGEGVDDLESFAAKDFAEAIAGGE